MTETGLETSVITALLQKTQIRRRFVLSIEIMTVSKDHCDLLYRNEGQPGGSLFLCSLKKFACVPLFPQLFYASSCFTNRPFPAYFGFMQIALQASLACAKNKKNLNLQRGFKGNLYVHKRMAYLPFVKRNPQ